MFALLKWIQDGKATMDLALSKGWVNRSAWGEAVKNRYFSTSKRGCLSLTEDGTSRLAEERMHG